MDETRRYIAFAPLQGYTDCCYRKAHSESAGGVDEYYTPFVRIEGGTMRRRDQRDTDPEANKGVPTVPQVIARDRDEMARLCDALQQQGWRRIDLNMGCPFPMQVKAGRGCGLIGHPDRVAEIVDEMRRRPEVGFSLKMRLGQESGNESLQLLPLLNEAPLLHITLHPRLGRQQYRGSVDMEGFARFYEGCAQLIVYNGDIDTLPQMDALLQRFGRLKGFMVGRGLLAHPWMCGNGEPNAVWATIHRRVYEYATSTLCGESQVLSRLHALWEYQTEIPDKKQYKNIMRSTTLRRYREAVAQLGL